LESDESETFDAIARYVGETFRRNIGGYWELVLTNPRYMFYGIPQINGFYRNCIPISPFTLATASLDRRIGDCMSGALHNIAKRIELIKSGAWSPPDPQPPKRTRHKAAAEPKPPETTPTRPRARRSGPKTH